MIEKYLNRINSASNSSDFISIATELSWRGCAREEVKSIYFKAFNVAKNFHDYQLICDRLYYLRRNDFSFIWIDRLLKMCLKNANDLIDEKLLELKSSESDDFDWNELIKYTFYYYNLGIKDSSINMMEWLCNNLSDIYYADLLVALNSMAELNPENYTDKSKISQLISILKLTILKYTTSESILYYKGQKWYSYDDYDFDCDDINNEAKIAYKNGLEGFADLLYRVNIEELLKHESFCFKAVGLFDTGIEIAKKDLLNDEEWAINLILEAVKYSNRECLEYILSNLGKLNNVKLENLIYRLIIEKDGEIISDPKILKSCIISLSDSELKHDLLSSSIYLSLSAFQIFEILDNIKGKIGYENIYSTLNVKLKKHNDYLFALLDRYAIKGDATLEEFKKAVINTDGFNVKSEFEYNIRTYNAGKNWSLLIRSCFLGQNEIIRFLIENGADLSYTNDQGLNALIASLMNINIKKAANSIGVDKDLIFKILKSGLDINSKFYWHKKNETIAFNEAACDGYLDIIKEMYAMGVDFLQNDKGKNALLSASYTCRIDVLKFLIKIGCDATSINEYPIFRSFNSERKMNKVIEMLRKAGAKF
ncbi:ankyrin repeat domain-containing protein [Aureibacter tunicatorum]|uniref:Ankyrin repeat protein n=1 Tax=Aureibacter tunicatorum TaxID=866807 RepID=A0AAE4BT44_9BACT|nr:ankyrin repeat domain-containing protein [Aureibacter tunicatorum]MDR6239127.1 hypothetical protein [Aureibacter tunicatorum]BDD04947.1 hypothetical protein AUTU_24300 [Aureibacter tunicatorum]